MVRRVGYIVGLLFVLACMVAYPLTWARASSLAYERAGGWAAGVGIASGHIEFTLLHAEMTMETRLVSESRPRPMWARDLYAVDVNWSKDEKVRRIVMSVWLVELPLWMPAAVVSLFMAWRWRRSRRQRATGFPLDQRRDQPTKNSA